MPRPKKRTRTLANKASSSGITIKQMVKRSGGHQWSTWLVQGWQEDGKWKRRQFKERRDAEAFAAVKRIELQNADSRLQNRVTTLTSEQVRQAESAFTRLGDRYTLDQAVDFFLGHFCEPDFVIRWKKAVEQYLEAKEDEGVRANTLRQAQSVLAMAQRFFDNPYVHEITSQDVERFLKGLRAKDGTNRATPKTWNNYRADLHAFFGWCADPRRRWIPRNPAADVPKLKLSTRSIPETLDVQQTLKVMTLAMRWRGGIFAKHFALLLFTGIRPKGELPKLAVKEAELIDLKRGVIHVPPDVSKTRQYRQILIRDNLREWLEAYQDVPIIPVNFDRLAKRFRKHCGLGHDVARHSYISHHVAAFKSVGEASLEAGNSESVVRRHYLNLFTMTEGKDFWRIVPSMENRRAVLSESLHDERILRLG